MSSFESRVHAGVTDTCLYNDRHKCHKSHYMFCITRYPETMNKQLGVHTDPIISSRHSFPATTHHQCRRHHLCMALFVPSSTMACRCIHNSSSSWRIAVLTGVCSPYISSQVGYCRQRRLLPALESLTEFHGNVFSIHIRIYIPRQPIKTDRERPLRTASIIF